jgi:hypothetical protein
MCSLATIKEGLENKGLATNLEDLFRIWAIVGKDVISRGFNYLCAYWVKLMALYIFRCDG